jgi:uncharacterized protein (DUF362 family)
MANFVNIRTLFGKITPRTIDSLRGIYEDAELTRVVSELMNESIDKKLIHKKKILLKPNWVKHSAVQDDEICLRTHDRFVLTVLEAVLKRQPSKVTIGDAPIQGCKWNLMVGETFIGEVRRLSNHYDVPVFIKDFRRVVFDVNANLLAEERVSMDDFLIFDVGEKSYLEPISEPDKNLFRVSQYNADKFKDTHSPGVHKYCITKELFDADMVISLPKIKTHQKAGITGALKNIVGLNGDKDFLPHHRIGGDKMGGDSYQGKNILRYGSELSLDIANRNKGKFGYWFWIKVASVLWRISLPGHNHKLSAAWYGNDTTWRMVMDLNLIVMYGKASGSLANERQRYLYSFSDGIIGGQGDGPLRPIPLELGIISLSNNSAWADLVHATIMGLELDKIPLLQAAKDIANGESTNLLLNGKVVKLAEFRSIALNAIMPPGWVSYKDQPMSKV